MTRKHFTAIADRILRNRQAGMDSLTLDCLSQDLAYEFSTFSDTFDRARFLKACGYEGHAALNV